MQTTGSEAGRRTFAREVLVLGIGNILWADEGFGPRAAEAFHQAFRPVEGVDVMDGGTLGMYLLELIGSTKDLLLFDCADLQEKPGTLKLLTNDEVKFWSATKISPHQTGMNEVLALAEKEKIAFNEEQYERSLPLLKTQLKALIARDLWDMSEYFQVMNTTDRTVQQALKVLNEGEYERIMNRPVLQPLPAE